jgi:hypothetical protein
MAGNSKKCMGRVQTDQRKKRDAERAEIRAESIKISER